MELILAKELVKLLHRDFKKYARIVFAIYISDLIRKTHGLRPAYFFCRALDDMADGDRDLPQGVKSLPELVNSLKNQLETSSSKNLRPELGILLNSAVKTLSKHAPREEIMENFRQLLNVMLRDFERRTQKVVFTVEQLHKHYRQSFEPVHNLAFIAFGSQLRSQDLGLLALLQGRAYAIPDLMQELPRGEINIPQEVIDQSGISAHDLMAHPELLQTNPVLNEWQHSEIRECSRMLETIKAKLESRGEVKLLYKTLLPPIEKIIEKQL